MSEFIPHQELKKLLSMPKGRPFGVKQLRFHRLARMASSKRPMIDVDDKLQQFRRMQNIPMVQQQQFQPKPELIALTHSTPMRSLGRGIRMPIPMDNNKLIRPEDKTRLRKSR